MSTSSTHLVTWPPPALHHARHDRSLLCDPLAAPPAPVGTPPTGPRRLPASSVVLALLPLRLFLAAGWLRAGVEKLLDRRWWSGGVLRSFLSAHHDSALPFFRPVMEHAIAPGAPVVSGVVMASQIACGVAIGIGRPIGAALRWGAVLNVTFILCGQVNPSAFYLVIEAALLVAMAEGTIGGRRTKPSRATLAGAGIILVVGIALTPFIRTLEPADVITDPAMMLAFLAFVVSATMMLRWILGRDATAGSRTSRWAQHASRWMSASREEAPGPTRSSTT